MEHDRYNPVPFDVEATRERWMENATFAGAFALLEDEYVALDELLRARLRVGMTQADVAQRMGVAQSSVGRLESTAGNRKHAPSLATLRKYAAAVGCDLRITLMPRTKLKRKAKAA